MDQLTFVIGARLRRRAGRRRDADRRGRRRADPGRGVGRDRRHHQLRDRDVARSSATEGGACPPRCLTSSGAWSATTAAYFVGGCVRDVRLGLPVTDVDVVVPGDPATVARRLARETGGSPFALSEAHGAWRVVLDGRTVDITAQRGGDILADLGERDFTVNAMAIPVDGDGEADVVDPFGGLGDLAEGRLRLVSDRVFTDDPLRLLRLARIAHELGFEVDPEAERLARRDAHLADRPAGERIYAEVRRLLDARPSRRRRPPARRARRARRRSCPRPARCAAASRARSTTWTSSSTRSRCSTPPPTSPRTPSTTCPVTPSRCAPRSTRPSATSSTRAPRCGSPCSSTTSRSRARAPSRTTAGSASWATTARAPRPPRASSSAGGRRRRRSASAHCSSPSTCGWASWCTTGRSTAGTATATSRPRRRTPMRAWSCRSPTASRRGASARVRRTCGPTPRRPTSCSRSSPSSSPRIASRCFAATRSPR